MTDIPIDKLCFAYWASPGQISRLVVPIKNTPHYRFAVQAINTADPVRNLPQGTGYGRYARWEAYCMHGRALRPEEQMHSESKFAANVATWRQHFDTSFYIQVCLEPFGTYVIEDGAHRAAFLAAVGRTTIKATIVPMQPNTYTGIDPDALTVEKIISMAETIPRS